MPSGTPPRGPKKPGPGRAETQRRVDAVFDLLLSGAARKEIIQFAAKETSWGVSPRQIDEYIRRANARFVEDSRIHREREMGHAIDLRHALILRLMKVQDYKGAAGVAADLAKLLGLYAPSRVEASGPAGGPIPTEHRVVYLPEEQKAEVARILWEAGMLRPPAPPAPPAPPTNGKGEHP